MMSKTSSWSSINSDSGGSISIVIPNISSYMMVADYANLWTVLGVDCADHSCVVYVCMYQNCTKINHKFNINPDLVNIQSEWARFMVNLASASYTLTVVS